MLDYVENKGIGSKGKRETFYTINASRSPVLSPNQTGADTCPSRNVACTDNVIRICCEAMNVGDVLLIDIIENIYYNFQFM